jgi:hypothetical protein
MVVGRQRRGRRGLEVHASIPLAQRKFIVGRFESCRPPRGSGSSYHTRSCHVRAGRVRQNGRGLGLENLSCLMLPWSGQTEYWPSKVFTAVNSL